MTGYITDNFTWGELTRTDIRDLANEPGAVESHELVQTAHLLERVRARLGKPLVVHSAYRSPAVNARIGGSVTSQHMAGQAADFHPLDLDLWVAFEALRTSDLPYDQLIFEKPQSSRTGWLHISHSGDMRPPRRQALAFDGVSYRTVK